MTTPTPAATIATPPRYRAGGAKDAATVPGTSTPSTSSSGTIRTSPSRSSTLELVGGHQVRVRGGDDDRHLVVQRDDVQTLGVDRQAHERGVQPAVEHFADAGRRRRWLAAPARPPASGPSTRRSTAGRRPRDRAEHEGPVDLGLRGPAPAPPPARRRLLRAGLRAWRRLRRSASHPASRPGLPTRPSARAA